MSGRRAKAVRRHARRLGIDPLHRASMIAVSRATGASVRFNAQRNAYRHLKREVAA